MSTAGTTTRDWPSFWAALQRREAEEVDTSKNHLWRSSGGIAAHLRGWRAWAGPGLFGRLGLRVTASQVGAIWCPDSQTARRML